MAGSKNTPLTLQPTPKVEVVHRIRRPASEHPNLASSQLAALRALLQIRADGAER